MRVLVSNGATTIEVDGQFGGFSTAGEFFNVQTDSLDMHIRWQQLAAVFAVEKPGHMDGTATRSFQFFDQTGAAAFKVFLNFGGPISPEREALFIELRSNSSGRDFLSITMLACPFLGPSGRGQGILVCFTNSNRTDRKHIARFQLVGERDDHRSWRAKTPRG